MDRRNFLKSMGALAAVAVGVPTFIAIKDDGTRTRISGATTKKDFIEKLGL